MRFRRLLAGVAAAALPLLAAPALSQNLVVNSGFATDLTAWSSFGSASPTDGSRAWNTDDAASSLASGSALLSVSASAAPGTVIGLSQCLAVTAGTTYAYYAFLKFPTGQTSGESRAVMELGFFSDGACATPLNLADGNGAVTGTAYPLSDTAWYTVPGLAPTLEASAAAPAGAASAEVRIYLERVASGAAADTAKFDVVVVHDAATVPVGLTAFTAE